MVTATFFKNEEAFIKLAKDNGKLGGGERQDRVILFRENCTFGQVNQAVAPDGTFSDAFAGGVNPIKDINEIDQAQTEYEFQLKRIQTVCQNL